MKTIAGIVLFLIGFFVVGYAFQHYGQDGVLPWPVKLGIMGPFIGGFILVFWKD